MPKDNKVIPQWVVDTYVKLCALENSTKAQREEYRFALLNFFLDEGFTCPLDGENVLEVIQAANPYIDWKSIAMRLACKMLGKDAGIKYIAKTELRERSKNTPIDKILIKPNGLA